MKNKEMDKIYEWGIYHSGNYSYAQGDKGAESYFTPHDGESYIREYDFDTITELNMELDQMWDEDSYMKEIIKPVAVAAMKNKPENIGGQEKRGSLSEYIYVF